MGEDRMWFPGEGSESTGRMKRFALEKAELWTQGLSDPLISFSPERFDPTVSKDLIDFPIGNDLWQQVNRSTFEKHERRAEVGKVFGERADCVEKELHSVRKFRRSLGGEEVGVENE